MSWRDRYPKKEEAPINPNTKQPGWPFLGYLSEMVNLALVRDDPEAFVGFMRDSGLDNTSRTFDGLTMDAYCEKRGAMKCKEALKDLESVAA
jgi:hypothetical protein